MYKMDELVEDVQNLDDMVEVELVEKDDFLKIRETLTRIGIASTRDEKNLYQSCHILFKNNRYYVVHFKELFILDGKPSTFRYGDMARRNGIVKLLENWGLLKVVDPEKVEEPQTKLESIRVLPYKKKHEWNLCVKYDVKKVRFSA